MATLADIVTDALRRLAVIREGAAVNDYQMRVGLQGLNDLLNTLPNRGVGEVLQTERVDASYAVRAPSILHVMASSGVTVTLPKQPKDGYRVRIVDVGTGFATSPVTVARNGWLIDGVSGDAILDTDGQSVEYFFRAELGDWKSLTTPLAQAADLPYPAAHDSDFKALLAVEIADFFGAPLTESLVARASSALTRLQGQYKPDMAVTFDRSLTCPPSTQTLRWIR